MLKIFEVIYGNLRLSLKFSRNFKSFEVRENFFDDDDFQVKFRRNKLSGDALMRNVKKILNVWKKTRKWIRKYGGYDNLKNKHL